MFNEHHPLFRTYRIAKRIAIAVVGGTVLVMGCIMMITPGPGIPAILAGLGILAVEFAWARVWLKKMKARAQSLAARAFARNAVHKARGAPVPVAVRLPRR